MRPDELSRLDDRTVDLLSRQLDRYQSIISRLAGNGVQVRTWSVTTTGALAALAIERNRGELLAVGLAVLLVFWALSAYYLALERDFRRAEVNLAEEVLAAGAVRGLLVIEQDTDRRLGNRVWSGAWSPALWPFYVSLAMLLGLGLVLVD